MKIHLKFVRWSESTAQREKESIKNILTIALGKNLKSVYTPTLVNQKKKSKLIQTKKKINTADPQITSYCSTFPFNTDKIKNGFLGGAIVCVEFVCFPHVYVGVLQVLWFPPHPKDVHFSLPDLSKLSQHECIGVYVCVSVPCNGMASCPGWWG